MPPIKFRERLTKFMISISLSEKFCCQNLITSIKVINMTRNSSKSNKLRNINTIGCRTRNFTIIIYNKQYACMVFCDISKAFDRVWHKGLLFKLKQNGKEGDFLEWISNYLEDRKQYVVLNSTNSEIKGVTAGVPQGSVLGPLLFLIYVNDITEQLLCLTRLFADDSSLFTSATDIHDIEA